MAVVNYFLKLDGIQGESRDAKHKGEIELESFSWSETSSIGRTGTGGGAGKTDFGDLHVAMKVSKASPLLLLAGASGQHLKQAVLTARKAGKAQLEFLVIKLTDVIVSSYSVGGSTADEPNDSVSFDFSRIEVEYRPQNPDGSLALGVKAGWDLKANKKV